MRDDWVECKVSDVGEISTGSTPSKKISEYYSSSDFPFYKPTDLNTGYSVLNSKDHLSDLGYRNSRKIDAGAVLVTCIGATIGKTGLIRTEGAFNQQINAVTPKKNILSEFLFFQFISIKFQKQIKGKASSTTLPILNKSKFSKLLVKIPSLLEQRAIVAKIESLFADLDKGIADLKKAQDQLKIYRQAVLKKAFEGKFKFLKLSELTDIRGGVTKGRKLGDKETINLSYLRVANVQDGYLDLNVIKTIDVLPTDLEKYRLEFEDILFTEGGDRDKLGRGTVWRNEIKDCIHQNHIFRARVKDKNQLFPLYLTYYAQSPDGKDFFFKHGKHTTNLASINKTILSSLPVPLPTIKEQHQIVQEIESRLSVCDKVEQNITESLEKADALRQSILKKAFEGTLLTEEEREACKAEPDYEPAALLLEKIKAEKKKK